MKRGVKAAMIRNMGERKRWDDGRFLPENEGPWYTPQYPDARDKRRYEDGGRDRDDSRYRPDRRNAYYDDGKRRYGDSRQRESERRYEDMDDPRHGENWPMRGGERWPEYEPDINRGRERPQSNIEPFPRHKPMQKIGFSIGGEMGRAEEFNRSRMDHGGEEEMTREMSEEWVSGMKNADGTTGPHWNMDQAKRLMAQYKVEGSPYDFYAVLNSIYSDYCKVARKFGVGDKIDFYVEMAKAWLEDEDAEDDKAARYFEYIVCKE